MTRLTNRQMWTAVESRDDTFDGLFVYAVKTTSVFCRPSCNSRRPNRTNVQFFESAQAAQAAGFRPCKRCQAGGMDNNRTADTVRKACQYITESNRLPSLKQVARHVGLSPAHFQRLFSEALGISPRNYADAIRQNRLRESLQAGDNISGALYDAGYGSTSRIYEFSNKYLGMSPGRFRQGGKQLTIWFTVTKCALGHLLIAATSKGICSVMIGDDRLELEQELVRQFHSADIKPFGSEHSSWTQALVDYLAEKGPWPVLPYDVRATAFQRKVWDWLRTIPSGKTCTYSEVAEAIGKPSAARAVARACATNPVAIVIPCHRIVPKQGGVGGYRWHPERKKNLLRLEAQTDPKS